MIRPFSFLPSNVPVMFFLRFPIRSNFAPFLFLLVFWCTYSASARLGRGSSGRKPSRCQHRSLRCGGRRTAPARCHAPRRLVAGTQRQRAGNRPAGAARHGRSGQSAAIRQHPVLAAEVQIAVDRVLADAVLKDIDRKSRPSDTELLRYARTLYDAKTRALQCPGTNPCPAHPDSPLFAGRWCRKRKTFANSC